MTRIFTEGFESGDTLAMNVATYGAGIAQVRSGSYSLQGAQGNSSTGITISGVSEVYFRCAHWTNGTSGTLLKWRIGATELGSLRFNSTNRCLELYTGTATYVAGGTHPIPSNAWFLYEVHIKIDASAGVLEAKIDGVLDSSFNGNTKPGTATTFDNFLLPGTGTNVCYMDDIAINNTSGSVDNSWCGDGRIIALVPNANGDLSQLMGSDGNTTDNYLLVDEKPSNGDTDYVEGSVVDEKDLYNMSATGLASNNIIRRVWVESRSRDTASAGGSIALAIKTNSTEYLSSNITLLGTYTASIKGIDYPLNPNSGVAWTISDVDALQAGPVTRS